MTAQDTPRRADINRANAQHSTGPKTDEGKQAASRNAAKHGFLARVLPAEQPEYRELLQSLREDLRPTGKMQDLLIEEIALAYVRTRRIHAYEMSHMEEHDVIFGRCTKERGNYEEAVKRPGISVADYFRDKPQALVLRYESGCQRTINRCLACLKELKDSG